jgi:pyruvate dehydrogenase E2 component (dihydrolipoamide acetyltransferase)
LKGNAVATEFKLPELGENIESGDVVRIAVTAGETVKQGQTIVELETDKAVVEVPSTVNGVIEEVIVKPSQSVKVGDVLFTFTAAGNSDKGAPEKPAEAAPAKSETREADQPASEQPVAVAQAAAPEAGTAAADAPHAEFRLPELGENIES